MNSQMSNERVHATATTLVHYVRWLYEPNDIVAVHYLAGYDPEWYPASELPIEAARLAAANEAGCNIFIGLNPRSQPGSGADNVLLARCLSADWDGKDYERVERIVAKVGLPEPTLYTQSGHGMHAYWRLDDPLTDLAAWTRLQRRLSSTVKSDTSTHSPGHFVRLPGFMNWNTEPATACYVDSARPGRRYALCRLTSVLLVPLPIVLMPNRGDAF